MLLVLLPAGCSCLALSGAAGGEGISCSEAVEFAGGARMPAHSSDRKCTRRSWRDTSVDGTFRMPRGDVAGWMAENFPGESPLTKREYCREDLCVEQYHPAEHGRSDDDTLIVNVRAAYEEGGTALITLEAFEV
ncbi:hypothetical protein [Streptomyces sp. NPDC008001]|uniref:hypothetical protein n=1 Tax=Streptomyces sp. NPDC008001 TaxID=3364804 RepID=UPI0036EFC542